MQFGFVKYLYEQGFRPDAIYGTSVGSLNACGLAFQGIEGSEKFWASVKKNTDIFKFNLCAIFLRTTGLYNSKPLKKLMQKVVQGEPLCDAYACKVSLITGEVKYSHCKDSDYVDSVVASASIPTLVDAVGEWVDGGVREQAPLKQAIKDGAEKIVVVMCNPLKSNPDAGKVSNWAKNLLRTTELMSHEIFLNDIQNCLWYNRNPLPGKRAIELEVYAPEKLVIDSLDFNQEKIQPAIQYGYEQAKKGPLSNEDIENM